MKYTDYQIIESINQINASSDTILSNLTIRDDGNKERILFLDPNTLTKTVIPLGDFRVGYKLEIYNTGTSGTIIFDPNKLRNKISAGSFGKYAYDGSEWVAAYDWKRGHIKARAYRNAAQNVDTGWSKVLINTIDFDTEGVADVTTNNRITPNLPGYYHVSAQTRVGAVPDGLAIIAGLYKNGSYASIGSHSPAGASSYAPISIVSDVIYFNGTTDYLELHVYNYHTTLALSIASYSNYLSILGPF